jgi:hypothetical protein
MNPQARRRCLHCLQPFLPDYRNAYHQRFCSEPACQRASKQASQRRWLRKPENRNYFREPDNALRVRDWRRAHPGYWRPGRHRCEGAAKPQLAQTVAPATGVSAAPPSGTLKDFCRSKAPVFSELISQLSRCALKEDIAHLATLVVSEAQCILLRCQLNISPPGQLDLPMNFDETGSVHSLMATRR